MHDARVESTKGVRV